MNNPLLSSKTGRGILLALVASLLLCSGNASAQDYIGGSFNFQGSSAETVSSNSHRSTATSINVSPDLGWFVGERWAVGIRPRIGFGNNSNGDLQSKTISLGINPYARYQLLALNRFGLWGEADPDLNFTRRNQYSNGSRVSYDRSVSCGIDILPVLTYQLNRHISLESRLNIFSFGLREASTNASDDTKYSSFSCGLRAATQNIFGAIGDVTIGFLYKF